MWPFSRKIPSLDTLRDGEERWSLAHADIGGVPLLIRCNQGAKRWQSHPELSIKLGLAIPLKSPNPAALPDPVENELLGEVENLVCQEVSTFATGIQVLALTTGRMKELVFYIRPGCDIARLHQSIQAKVSTHEVQCLAEIDPKWTTYRQFSGG